MNVGNVFPWDYDTLCIIKEIEAYLCFKNKDIDKMNYTELVEYIEQITLMLLNKQVWLKISKINDFRILQATILNYERGGNYEAYRENL